jgi:hypothetical protein
MLTLVMCGPAMADEAADLVKKLDAETFREREDAAERLQSLGKEAIPALIEGVNAGNLETAIRAIDILKNLMEAEDKDTSGQAKSALEKLAESDNAAMAKRAKNALAPKPEPVVPGIQNRIQIGGFAPLPVIAGNGVRRISTKIVNGVKTVEADEGDRKITINEDPNKGIAVEITETKNGKETTEKFEAKTEEDLKKNHPKAHAEYAKYVKGNGAGIQINVNGVRFGRGLPGVPAVPIIGRANNARLEAAGRLLQSIGQHVETVANDNAIKDASNDSRETFKKEVVEMKNRLAELEKKLQAAIDEENKKQEAQDKPADEKPANAER